MNTSGSLDRKSLLISIVFIVLLILISGGMAVYVMSDRSLSYALTMTQAAFRIEEQYRSDVDWPELVDAGRRGMFERLDRYSSYFRREQFQSLDEELEGSYVGIGVSVVFHEEGLMIMSVRENGPAAEVGLLTGDVIVASDSVLLADMDGEEAVRQLRGEEGTPVLIRVRRSATDELFEVQVIRKRIPFMHIPFAGYTDDDFIYVRILDFDAGTTADLRKALDSLMTTGRPEPRGIILDLRGNPGGMFAESYLTADLFLKEGIFMVGTDGRSRWNDCKYYATGEDITGGLPVAVIVDRGTASSAEIVAGALRSSGRAVIVGDTTFGKGLVQGFVRYPDGDGLRLTISRYYFEGPVYLNDFDSTLNDIGHGLVPDYFFDVRRMSPIRRELENSLLLRKFAYQHQDEIIEWILSSVAETDVVDRFISFAYDSGFSYISPRTLLAEDLKETAEMETSKPGTLRYIDSLIKRSRLQDREALQMERDYISSRLMEIAFERKYGAYETYRQVLMTTRPEIRYASQVLAEGL